MGKTCRFVTELNDKEKRSWGKSTLASASLSEVLFWRLKVDFGFPVDSQCFPRA